MVEWNIHYQIRDRGNKDKIVKLLKAAGIEYRVERKSRDWQITVTNDQAISSQKVVAGVLAEYPVEPKLSNYERTR